MRGKIFQGVKPIVIAIATVVVLGLSASGLYFFKPFSDGNNKQENQSISAENRRTNTSGSSESKNLDEDKTAEESDQTSDDNQEEQTTSATQRRTRNTRSGQRQTSARSGGAAGASTNSAPGSNIANYTIKYTDQSGKVVLSRAGQGLPGQEITVDAEDVFDKGYEIFDAKRKSIKLASGANEIVFKVGKARELMSLAEFTKHEVRYDYPIEFRNLDFTGRQEDLQDFVVKKIYHREKDTGVFYGTKDQAELIRKTMLNGSFQGAYARYAYNIRDIPAKHIKGDKYELKIEFDYVEHPEWMKLG